MIEYLTCQSCFGGWSRTVKRGRKPSLCPRCRPVSVVRTPSKVVELTDGGMSKAGFRESNDCTVRALATATGVGYLVAHDFMRANGRKPRRGAPFRDILIRNSGQALGHTFEMPMTFIRTRGIRASMERNPDLRSGVWILKMRQHVATLRNGKLIDSFDSSRKDVLYAWKVVPASAGKQFKL